jgi:signal peptidase I
MFSFLYSEQKKMRRNAQNWLEVADRVYKFRRDQLNEAQTKKLLTAVDDVKLRLKEQADADRIKLTVEKLESALRETGGRIYPVSSIVENVEFFLVAAIMILGLRAYFVQPFKIPTNSMWPTYYGMTSETFKPGEEPGLLGKAARMVGLGAVNYSVTAPADGEVYVGVFGSNLWPAFAEKPGRTLLVFPATMHEHVFSVGGELARVKVPADFESQFNGVVTEAFFKSQGTGIERVLRDAVARHLPVQQSTIVVRDGVEQRIVWVPTGLKVRRGENFLSFDILTGDMLFVDRFTYNFFPPKVGSGFVFKTGNIHSPAMLDQSGEQIQQYYIKRLVGVPGDQLEIRKPAALALDGVSPAVSSVDGQLFRNGHPIDGSPAFGKNSRKEGLYPGYTADGSLAFGQVLSIPNNSYFAMGDNSPNSMDSRFWGFVPDKEVVGRPLFIYYPLTSRWGLAR